MYGQGRVRGGRRSPEQQSRCVEGEKKLQEVCFRTPNQMTKERKVERSRVVRPAVPQALTRIYCRPQERKR
jgi:hypothetical protein